MKSQKIIASSILSLATVASLSAFELENTKVSGEATLYYNTVDQDMEKVGLFQKGNSQANFGFSVKLESQLGNDYTFVSKLNSIQTFGAEGSLVNGVMQTSGDASTSGDANPLSFWYFGEAYLQKVAGNTIVRIGRQELDTPWAFSETWNVVPNSFDAAVVINQDVENLTLIGAWVGATNGHDSLTQFSKFKREGAFMGAGVYKADNMVSSGFIYHIPAIGNALWADTTINMAESGTKLTGQLAYFTFDSDASEADDTLGVVIEGKFKASEATCVSLALGTNTGKSDSHSISNVGTGHKTKLATATALNNYDVAMATDTTAVKAGIVQKMESSKLTAQLGMYMHGADSSVGADFQEETGMAGEIFYETTVDSNLDIMAGYLYNDKIAHATDGENASHTVRAVARVKF